MPLEIGVDHLQTISTHAASTYPQECCGLLLGQVTPGNRSVMTVRPVQNTWNQQVATEMGMIYAQGKADRYWIDPAEMLMVMREARSQSQAIVGVYHSHPNQAAIPSECDRQLAWAHYSYLIVSVMQGAAVDWQSWAIDEHCRFQPEPLITKNSTMEATC